MLCENVEDNNSESNADDCGLACGVLEEIKDSIGAIYVKFWIKNWWLYSTRAEESGMINKKPDALKWNLCFAAIVMLWC